MIVSGGAVAIGASAGAIQMLLRILPALPKTYPLPVFVVVHVPPGRRSELATLFAGKCRIAVQEAEDKQPVIAGTITFAPPDYHMLIETDRTLSLSTDDPVFFSRPSIDVLFESAADAYGAAMTGVILTGANEDGANGLRAIGLCGGRTIVQNPATAYARAMPEAALARWPSACVLGPDQIVESLIAAVDS
ncbi:chemotaxis protein CheB [Novosphingobium sp. Leaf2]|uniref:chemotaxis protein CheB n=1 Tax=Novosphingobium sp. Leaf2 TaxID=1735670 RepID=UPI0006FCF24C|nr:chemotaxis protein CheB [Novosphingobium sp. Leaf2]KQM21029.1 chemotaxis protein CheB [Novosphingobium sp. Leaf2]